MEHPDIRGLERWRLLVRDRHAAVWEARQPALDRSVAVKVYSGPVSAAVQHEFLRVTAGAARLAGHPGVVTVHDAGVLPDGRPYVVEQLATGGSVAAWLEAPGSCTEERVRQLGAAVADGLAAAHAAGLVHGGIRPPNILVDGYDAPVLVDFGAAVLHAARPGGTSTTESGYAPPESGRGSGAAGDVYALAATLYALLTGQPPPASTGRHPAPRSSVRRSALPLWDVDPALRALLLAALDDDPAARPSAAELRDGLRARRGAVRAAATSSAAQAGPWGRGRSRLAVLVGAAALIVFGAGAAWLVGGPASPRLPTAARVGTPTAAPTDGSASGGGPTASAGSPARVQIELEEPTGPAEPFEAVQLRGTHRGGSGTTFLRVQRWEGGAWRAFPLPTRADRTGWFTTYVELGEPGRYPLRVVDQDAGVASEPVLLVVREA